MNKNHSNEVVIYQADKGQNKLKVNLKDNTVWLNQIKRETSIINVEPISYNEAIFAIDEMRQKYNASELFGKEKDESLKSSLQTVFQTFESKDFYPSIE